MRGSKKTIQSEKREGSLLNAEETKTADTDGKIFRGEKCAARRYRNFTGGVLTLSGYRPKDCE
jgi:hypothetical protein